MVASPVHVPSCWEKMSGQGGGAVLPRPNAVFTAATNTLLLWEAAPETRASVRIEEASLILVLPNSVEASEAESSAPDLTR